MDKLESYVLEAWQLTNSWELIAVFFAVLYLVLVIKESIWCWPAALVSTGIYIFLFFDVNLYMESALQFFYIVMALYGWMLWRKHDKTEDDLQITSWTVKQHFFAISLVFLLVLISGFLLETSTNAAYPWLDSLTTWGAVITTWMVTKKILENWIYWIPLNSISVFLFIQRDLYLTALLFIFYVMLCINGYKLWHQRYETLSKHKEITHGLI
ncbi:MAG: nicotinamide mononucleotide transporter [Gammaproteobacteria bacterium]|nr:MAG: nicotinamide mononucleotide transporter [Gammaproteobacteria bacterium]